MASTRVELKIEGGEFPTPASDYWFGAAAALLALTSAAAIARRRIRTAEIEPPRRLPRVLQPSLLFAGAISFWLVASELWAPSSMGPLPLVAGFALLVFAIVGLVIFAIADFWLGLARPRRTRKWLYLGMLAFAAALGLATAAAAVAAGAADDFLHPLDLVVLAIGAACGAVWWAYLPPTHPDTVRVFE